MPDVWSYLFDHAPQIVAIIGGLASLMFFVVKSYHATHQIQELKEKQQHLIAENNELKNNRIQPQLLQESIDRNQKLRDLLTQYITDRKRIIDKGNRLVSAYQWMEKQFKQMQHLATENKALKESLDSFKDENAKLSQEFDEATRQFEEIKSQDGNIWQRPVKPTSPPFRAREDRGFPIISVMNLKGGVGKTTLTTHIAAILGQMGKRVLIIDLDYQRSLSLLLLKNDQRKLLHLERRTLQHFLTGATHRKRDLLKCAVDIPGLLNCQLVANSDERGTGHWQDSLEETESRLMTDWITQNSEHDIRLLLREALHDPELTRQYDYVLLDCPPRMTTAAMNALAASDFVLIPVILDAMSSRALPEFLHSLNKLTDSVLKHLNVLAVVANMITPRQGKAVSHEQVIWEQLPYAVPSVWPKAIPFCQTMIPQRSAIAKSTATIDDGEVELAWNKDDIHEKFTALVQEIEKEVTRK